MNLFLLTTKYPGSLLESKEILTKQNGIRAAYHEAAPTFYILSSYKVDQETTIDIVEAESIAEAKKAANAISRLTDTKIDVSPLTPYHRHLQSLIKAH